MGKCENVVAFLMRSHSSSRVQVLTFEEFICFPRLPLSGFTSSFNFSTPKFPIGRKLHLGRRRRRLGLGGERHAECSGQRAGEREHWHSGTSFGGFPVGEVHVAVSLELSSASAPFPLQIQVPSRKSKFETSGIWANGGKWPFSRLSAGCRVCSDLNGNEGRGRRSSTFVSDEPLLH